MSVDLSGTGMVQSVRANWEAKINDGLPVLVRGRVGEAVDGRGAAVLVTEIWQASSEDDAEGVWTLIRDTGIECETAPCNRYDERKLNSTRKRDIASVDFEPSMATEEAIAYAKRNLADEGLIIVGNRYTGFGGMGRTVNRFFTKVPVPLLTN